MKKSRKYRATDVKNVLVDRVLAASPEGAATAGIDISKFEAWAVMRWRDGSFERPWKARIPSQMDELVAALRRIGQQRPLVVAMESTGTYGDALRARLTAAGLEVHRVGGKAAHDYAEIFDGVPSQHDGKDAAVIAELSAFGKSSPWPYRPPSKWEAELTYWVDWLDGQQRIQMLWTVQKPPARGWYEGKKKRDKDRGKGALIAVMRKLAVALYAVGARGEPFEAWRLYPGSSSARKAVQVRMGTRSRKCVLEGMAGQEE